MTDAGASLRAKSSDLDWKCVNTIRLLGADMVQAANSGHPGAPMGMAPMAHVLFSRFYEGNPKNPKFAARDRFVLSNGHACALQYSMLHLLGYDLSLDDLKAFRKLDSRTPGHPENFQTPGIEVTTGPLGQGFANAVGLAIAESHLAARFNRDGFKLFDNYTYVFVGDGCLQEGVCAEAASLAGHLGLGKLIVLYDANNIQIDGSTDLAFTENVLDRFKSYGWHTDVVADGDNDLVDLERAIAAARLVTDAPSIIRVTTTIGYGSKSAATEKVHGAPLGAADLAHAKTALGFAPDASFVVPDAVREHYAAFATRGAAKEAAFDALVASYRAAHPELAAELERRLSGALPADWKSVLPRYAAGDAPAATRKFSQKVLNKLAEAIPELVGGSADLTHSNLTWLDCSHDYQKATPTGRYLRFGVREHAMAAICNGLAAYGVGFVPFCSTFLTFIGYAQGAYRLSALSHHGVLYIMTHDSIGLGEDGPTHQPIEALASLRATPNVFVVRPADGNETSGAYAVAIEARSTPTVLSLTRQNLPNLEGSSVEKVALGGYVLQEAQGGAQAAKVIFVATGSEVALAVDAAKILAAEGVAARVVSMPCTQLFDAQSAEYRRSVLLDGVPTISVEAGIALGWASYAHAHIAMPSFGASGPASDIFKKFGFTPAAVADSARKVIAAYKDEKPHRIVREIAL